ncbi:hypothetical protein HETIRDRAFT_416764 [Heterobasidion irregulare TC 32-1]|uniref:Arrestin C-terminal-like domain-containing protein n=1 Tax=Heterobasidion irregulare (strain TC 32-1) TaxID=747525 RepID=W4K9Y2_HETIT|nr:uncharacterized protein HETIRDRAFT_416764 [Heterobasidion irregulare TC 32-1]ETW82652.1 hypothetical protein HETIRDRAFT_416764 [Heterobasidion irregulare TC 32-1]
MDECRASTRPEPMNASPHHSKVNVSLTLSDQCFVAGGAVTGKMQMECRADRGLGIGLILVELVAIEELTSRDHSATSTFLHTRRLFQGPGLPPSNAVLPHPLAGEPPLPAHHYPARRGLTTFLFRLPVPPTSPSAINFGAGLARVRYEVRAAVGVAWKGENKLVTDKADVDVVEVPDERFDRADPEGVVVGEHGKIWIQGSVVGGCLVAGESACVELQVKNHSAKKNSSLSITLTRHLHLSNAPGPPRAPLQIMDTLATVHFRGPEYVAHPGTEGVALLVFDVPARSRTVKGGERHGGEEDAQSKEPLFEVRCTLNVRFAMPIGSKDIHLDLPVTIFHPYALPSLPPAPALSPPPLAYGAPTYDLPPPLPISSSPPLAMHSRAPYPDPARAQSPYAYPFTPPPLPPQSQALYDPHAPWFFPPPHPAFSPPPPLQQQHYYPPPLAPPIGIPPRPASAEPPASRPLHSFYPYPYPGAPHPPLPALLPPPPQAESEARVEEAQVQVEEGKGERASRFTHHLRMTSRHRSVSPQSHRFPVPVPMPAPALVPQAVALAGLTGLPATMNTAHTTHVHIPHTTASASTLPGPSPVPTAPTTTTTTDVPSSARSRTYSDALPPPLAIPPSPNSRNHSPSPIHSPAGEVLSPRPMASPKQTLAPAPGPSALQQHPHGQQPRSLSKSARVAELERMAAAVERATRDLSGDLPKDAHAYAGEVDVEDDVDGVGDMHMDKTLPSPPVPSGKARARGAARPPHVDTLFAPPHQPPVLPTTTTTTATYAHPDAAAPKTPALSALSLLKPPRGGASVSAGAGAESGLDALERRLLAEVGTRKLDDAQVQQHQQHSDQYQRQRRVDARAAVLPISIPPRGVADVDADAVNDSAISSLTLGIGAEFGEREREGEHGVGAGAGVGVGLSLGAGGFANGGVGVGGADGDGDGEHEISDERTQKQGRGSNSHSGESERGTRKGKARSVASSKGRSRGKEKEKEKERERRSGRKKDGRDEEALKLRKAAKGRVADWLNRIDPDVPPPPVDSPRTESPAPASPAVPGVPLIPPVPPPSSSPVPPADVDPSDAKEADAERQDASSAPNPRSSGFVPLSTLRARQASPSRDEHPASSASSATARDGRPTTAHKPPTSPLSPRARFEAALRNTPPPALNPKPPLKKLNSPPVFPPRPADSPAKYDVRSARGGRGGRVTAVTAIWASASATNTSTPSLPGARSPPPVAAPKPNALLCLPRSRPGAATPKMSSPLASPGPSKAASVPAVVSSSLATPMLSSTASLSRPPAPGSAQPSVPPRVPPIVEAPPRTAAAVQTQAQGKAEEGVAPARGGGLAFGQARLRDLIRKYQGQVAS